MFSNVVNALHYVLNYQDWDVYLRWGGRSSIRTTNRNYQAVDYHKTSIGSKAEARLAARRQARVEAREIRMREIERQQKEAEENADKAFDMSTADGVNINRISRVTAGITSSPRIPGSITNSYQSSRRNSIDSLDESTPNFRDYRMELKDLEEKFRKAMVQNAQLDNEKAAATYMVELYKDKYTDIEEELMHIKREYKESCRDNEKLKRLLSAQRIEANALQQELQERDTLIEEKGLVIVSTEQDEWSESEQCNKVTIRRALVSMENAQLLQGAGEGCLDVRLKKFADERAGFLEEISRLKLELQEAKHFSDIQCNGTDSDDLEDTQKETNKVLGDYKFKWQKAEQDISTLQANVARLDSQVIRYKTAAEAAEKAEDELKLEKRKMQRELREAQAKVEELETSNMHLLKRFDKLKNAKSSLLKDL
ncbi:leucine-rich repeat flightless-interacting protein 2 isoform X2 [Daktulosphaira vitifoliae]|uniref:leucine-rich repeat flightless-interacting protein 2 isoform X2 n=1 Tax=Daktulosphaira vitifoliae TaxID=58002 RepID=UPI0021AA6A4D|nr:leucine-rich repeat flightless-interacting protein 2 isoform X2 [Daktulosphaira vitifoliae]